MLKHIVIEHPKPDSIHLLEAAGGELQKVLVARGWRPYRAWRASAPETDGPGHFDVGMLGRATVEADSVVVFEAEFPDRAALDAQLAAVRNDPEAVRILIKAQSFIEVEMTRVLIVESWLASG